MDGEETFPLPDLREAVYIRIEEDRNESETILPGMRKADAYLQKGGGNSAAEMFRLSDLQDI